MNIAINNRQNFFSPKTGDLTHRPQWTQTGQVHDIKGGAVYAGLIAGSSLGIKDGKSLNDFLGEGRQSPKTNPPPASPINAPESPVNPSVPVHTIALPPKEQGNGDWFTNSRGPKFDGHYYA